MTNSITRSHAARQADQGRVSGDTLTPGRVSRHTPTPKTPGSRTTAAAIRSLSHAPVNPQPTLTEAIQWLYDRGARFVLMCDRCGYYSRPRCRDHHPELPASALKWSQWRPSPEDVRGVIGFNDPQRPSSDHWGVPVRHLPIGIEPASLRLVGLDVDRYELADVAALAKMAPPAALTISRGGGPHFWYDDPTPPYDRLKQRHIRRNGKFSWRSLDGDRKAFRGLLRVIDLVDLAGQLMGSTISRPYPAGIIAAAATQATPPGDCLEEERGSPTDGCVATPGVQRVSPETGIPSSRLQVGEGLEGCPASTIFAGLASIRFAGSPPRPGPVAGQRWSGSWGRQTPG